MRLAGVKCQEDAGHGVGIAGKIVTFLVGISRMERVIGTNNKRSQEKEKGTWDETRAEAKAEE